MLTDVLVGRMGFDGFTVGDWNGHGQIKGCNNRSCPESFNAGQDEVNIGDDDYHPLFAYGYGLSYAQSVPLAQLSEDPGLSGMDEDSSIELIARGKTTGAWRLNLRDADGGTDITDIRGASPAGWQTSRTRLSCFIEKGARMDSITEPLIIAAQGSLKLQIASVKLTTFDGAANCE